MAIPASVMSQLATLGLSEDQAIAVASMLTAVEDATKAEAEVVLERGRAKARDRVARWRETHGGNVTERNTTLRNGSRERVRREDKPLPQKRTQEESKKEEEDALSAPPSVAAALDAYSAMAGRAGLAALRVVTAARKARVAAILSEHGPAVWDEALAKVEASSFCRGQNERGWKADLDFILQPKTFPKILEGAYDDRVPQARAGPPRKRDMGTALDELEGWLNCDGQANGSGNHQAPEGAVRSFPRLIASG